VQRMQKALVQMNIQLAEVLTDVMGATGQAIIRAIVAGERDPQALARHRNGRVKASQADIARALTATGAMNTCSCCARRWRCTTTLHGTWLSAMPSCRR